MIQRRLYIMILSQMPYFDIPFNILLKNIFIYLQPIIM